MFSRSLYIGTTMVTVCASAVMPLRGARGWVASRAMPLSFVAAWGVVRRIQPGAGPKTRGHVLGRFVTCPFLSVVRALPDGARVLDVGAGHGIFAHLAAAAGARSVVALEPDRRKMLDWAAHPV